MPRQPRIDLPDMVYHVFTRGHNKAPLFLDDLDRRTFLKYLDRASEKCPWELLGYCLMGNHYHLQVKPLEIPLGKTMHLLNTLYAEYFNFRYGKVGHVFQNRYHSIPVEVDTYLLTLCRYIHLNPVVAGLASAPEKYEWSSYREYIGLSDPSGRINPSLVLDMMDSDKSRQRSTYRQYVESEIGKPPRFTETLIQKTRILGSARFIQKVRDEKEDARSGENYMTGKDSI